MELAMEGGRRGGGHQLLNLLSPSKKILSLSLKESDLFVL